MLSKIRYAMAVICNILIWVLVHIQRTAHDGFSCSSLGPSYVRSLCSHSQRLCHTQLLLFNSIVSFSSLFGWHCSLCLQRIPDPFFQCSIFFISFSYSYTLFRYSCFVFALLFVVIVFFLRPNGRNELVLLLLYVILFLFVTFMHIDLQV